MKILYFIKKYEYLFVIILAIFSVSYFLYIESTDEKPKLLEIAQSHDLESQEFYHTSSNLFFLAREKGFIFNEFLDAKRICMVSREYNIKSREELQKSEIAYQKLYELTEIKKFELIASSKRIYYEFLLSEYESCEIFESLMLYLNEMNYGMIIEYTDFYNDQIRKRDSILKLYKYLESELAIEIELR